MDEVKKTFKKRSYKSRLRRWIPRITAAWMVLIILAAFGQFFGDHIIPAVLAQDKQEPDWLALQIAKILFYVFVIPLGTLTTLLLRVLIYVSTIGTGEFTKTSGVVVGWALVRDISNMFFIIILLVIAFATVLRIKTYNYQALLPRLVIMAVLINFSKTIAGIFIDFSQVIMLTFINAMRDAAEVGLAGVLGLGDLLNLDQSVLQDPNTLKGITNTQVIVTLIAAILMLGIAAVTILIFIVTLVFRVAMLWFLVVLSPLAFLSWTFPNARKYSAQWWGEFGTWTTIGPITAFFLWLSLLIVEASRQVFVDPNNQESLSLSIPLVDPKTVTTESELNVGLSRATSSAGVSNFILAISLLLASQKFISQMSTQAGSVLSRFTGKGAAFLAGAMIGAYKWGGRTVGGAAYGLGRAGVQGIDYAAGGIGGRNRFRPFLSDRIIHGVSEGLSGVPLIGGSVREWHANRTHRLREEAKKAGEYTKYTTYAEAEDLIGSIPFTRPRQAAHRALSNRMFHMIPGLDTALGHFENMDTDDMKQAMPHAYAAFRNRVFTTGSNAQIQRYLQALTNDASFFTHQAGADRAKAAGWNAAAARFGEREGLLPQLGGVGGVPAPANAARSVVGYANLPTNDPRRLVVDENQFRQYDAQLSFNPAHPEAGRYHMERPFDREKYLRTLRMSQQQGDALFQSPEFNAEMYYPQAQFGAMQNQRKALGLDTRDQQLALQQVRVEQQLNRIGGADSLIRKGERGDTMHSATLAVDFSDVRSPELAHIQGKLGANLSGTDKQAFIHEVAGAMENVATNKEAAQKQWSETAEPEKEKILRTALSAPGKSNAQVQQELESLTENQEIELFQKSQKDRAAKFRTHAGSLDTLSVINKGREIGDARMILTHEKAHDEMHALSTEEKDEVWSAIPQEAQKHLTEQVQQNWAGLKVDPADTPEVVQQKQADIKEEALSEIMAYSRLKGIGKKVPGGAAVTQIAAGGAFAEVSKDVALMIKEKSEAKMQKIAADPVHQFLKGQGFGGAPEINYSIDVVEKGPEGKETVGAKSFNNFTDLAAFVQANPNKLTEEARKNLAQGAPFKVGMNSGAASWMKNLSETQRAAIEKSWVQVTEKLRLPGMTQAPKIPFKELQATAAPRETLQTAEVTKQSREEVFEITGESVKEEEGGETAGEELGATRADIEKLGEKMSRIERGVRKIGPKVEETAGRAEYLTRLKLQEKMGAPLETAKEEAEKKESERKVGGRISALEERMSGKEPETPRVTPETKPEAIETPAGETPTTTIPPKETPPTPPSEL
ncbi:MAG: hypothetical protein A3G01_02620 [Candidatus Kerfeldbacteria bacterium RIFCSPLOWO2_12_FULL_43_9]|nr:MAG: hypothetical protein A3G01_02620 [Candidatus Kerfeldbacteria bacterium RIFCSPLOWO2_12_FULL_43_9]